MEKIGTVQFVSLLILFQIGSYVIFGFAGSAKQDAWLVALFSSGAGLGLAALYLGIYRLFPGENWIGMLRGGFGRWIGTGIGMIYALAFLYVSGRVLRDFGELVRTFILPSTPELIVLFCLGFCSYWALYKGVEVISRLAELMFFLLAVFLVLQTFLLWGSGLFHFEFLLPIAYHKGEIVRNLIPLGITVPFGESIAFLMFYHQLEKQEMLGKVVYVSTLFSGLLLSFLNLLAVVILGPELYARSIYPLLTAIQQVSIADFLENIDALVVVYIGIAAFFKITVFLYSASVGLTSVFGLRDFRTVLLPLGVLMMLLSHFMATNVVEHIFVGLHWVPWVLWVPLFIVIPLLLFVVALIRKGGDALDVEAAQEA